ncbi:MAG: hypothetical protein WCP32_19160 [Bacteroidota bacterium]
MIKMDPADQVIIRNILNGLGLPFNHWLLEMVGRITVIAAFFFNEKQLIIFYPS